MKTRESCNENKDKDILCRNVKEILNLINMMSGSKEYLDRNLIPTSEGMKILRKAIRISRERKMPCTEVIKKLEKGFHHLYDLYECYRVFLSECIDQDHL
ncbi:MAG: hypothetical protein QXJ51_01230 [Sulfolobales archaeon]